MWTEKLRIKSSDFRLKTTQIWIDISRRLDIFITFSQPYEKAASLFSSWKQKSIFVEDRRKASYTIYALLLLESVSESLRELSPML